MTQDGTSGKHIATTTEFAVNPERHPNMAQRPHCPCHSDEVPARAVDRSAMLKRHEGGTSTQP